MTWPARSSSTCSSCSVPRTPARRRTAAGSPPRCTDQAVVEVRDATPADLPSIVAMYADDPLGAGREQPGLPLDERYLSAFAAIHGDPNYRLVVGLVGDE